MDYQEDEYLMLSGIQHFAFCRRQWALIHIEQQWEDNVRTVEGELMHKRARFKGWTVSVGICGKNEALEFWDFLCKIYRRNRY